MHARSQATARALATRNLQVFRKRGSRGRRGGSLVGIGELTRVSAFATFDRHLDDRR